MSHSGDGERGVIVQRFAVSCGFPVSHTQLACCSTHWAFPWHGKDLRVHGNTHPEAKPLLLTGHYGKITAIVFGNVPDPLVLCSASDDYVIIWDVRRCYSRATEGLIAPGVVIGTGLGNALYLSLCPVDKRLAACVGDKIYILSTKKEEVLGVLEGHRGALTAADFCPWNGDFLVSTSEDRTFKVWNVKNKEMLYQSAVLSAFPLLSVFLSQGSRQLITGSADGQLWCFTLPDDHKCRMVTKLDCRKLEQRHLKHIEEEGTQMGAALMNEGDPAETAKPILRICAARLSADQAPEQGRFGSCFWVGSSTCLYLLDLATSELRTVLYLRDHPNLTIALAGSWAIQHGEKSNALCVAAPVFSASVVLMEVQVPGHCFSGRTAGSTEEGLSVVPSVPPGPESPLNAKLVRREASQPPKKTGSGVRDSMKAQPLVFHSKVKSSGYTASPRMTMFTPRTNPHKQRSASVRSSMKNGPCLFADYPTDTAPPCVLHTLLSTAGRPTPVCCFQYSGNGKQVLCGLGDRSALVYKASLTGTPAVYTGHDGAVCTVGWSHSGQWLVSAAEDRTVRVWSSRIPKPALTLGSDKFPKPVRCAQFYYLDKFLLLASGPELHLCLYHLDITHSDIKRYQTTGRFQTSRGTDITCASAINEFFSYIVLVCGSDRSVEVFDMNVGQISARIPNAHTRPIHHVTQNKGSMFSTQDLDLSTLMAISYHMVHIVVDQTVMYRCVRRYESHQNRCHPCTAAFSPCGRYIATGSEDNSAYLYDIRHSSYLHRLQRHSDTILNVAFNPSTPELLTGTLDGKLQLFRPGDGASLRL